MLRAIVASALRGLKKSINGNGLILVSTIKQRFIAFSFKKEWIIVLAKCNSSITSSPTYIFCFWRDTIIFFKAINRNGLILVFRIN